MDTIYLDHNSTTPVLPAVWEAMRPFLAEVYGNPASAHTVGRHARRALENAREQVAGLLDAHPDEVLFTSGATEANNLALFGLCGDPPGRLIASAVEHPSVLEPLRHLAARGFTLDLLPVDGTGIVRTDTLTELLRPESRLLAVMLANHETGAIQPVADLTRSLPLEGAGGSPPHTPPPHPFFHCDATQAVGKMPVCFHALGVTSLALSAHKFHGPKGIGALLLRRGVRLRPRLWGGHQQQGYRPGTEPVALVVGLATALQLAHDEAADRRERVLRLRQRFLERLRATISPLVLNGPETPGLPHTLNLSFPGLKADALLMSLDLAGVACSAGSACSSGSLLPSPVLQAMNVPEVVLQSALRFSLADLLSEAEIDEAAHRIEGVIRRLRQSTHLSQTS